jgi:hypothetical protein
MPMSSARCVCAAASGTAIAAIKAESKATHNFIVTPGTQKKASRFSDCRVCLRDLDSAARFSFRQEPQGWWFLRRAVRRSIFVVAEPQTFCTMKPRLSREVAPTAWLEKICVYGLLC